MTTSPSIKNLTIPKGIVQFTPDGGSLTDLGECSNFTYTQDITKKDYFSSRGGIRTKAKSVVSQMGATIKMTLNEVNEFNLGLFLLAESGTTTLGGLSQTDLTGTLTFTGTNLVGSQVNFTGKVQLQPGGDMSLVTDSDDWQAIPINAEVLIDGGVYGEWTVDDEPTA